MFRRARLSVKPNVRPGVGTRGSTAPHPQRGPEAPKPPEPAPESAPKPAHPAHVPAVDPGGAGPQDEAPGSSDAKTDGENNVEESSKPSSTVSQRRKRISSTSSLVKPTVSVPPPQPSSTVTQDALRPNPIPAKERQPCSDRYRVYKAQKLREMLKEELRKEKKQWKNKFATNESQRPPDRSKMTMRDFIYYLPDSNPMTSSLEQEKKTEKSLTPSQTRDRQENKSTPEAEDNEEVDEDADDGPLLVPRVKVAEDGSIILDEESLTVEVLRTKGPCVVEENDPIFERGSTTTYSSFRKNYYSKPWSNKETDMFFLAISMVGTDFSMIGQLFPHRARIEIKNKFKREEKTNGWRIDKAFQEKRPFDFDFFAHLLQKVLAEEEKRKQKPTKSQNSKEKSSKPRKSVKAKKATSEGGNDDPDESVSSNISDPERSQQEVQTVDEEETLTSSGQDLEQVISENDQNQRKRRKNQTETNEQEGKHLLGNACIQPGPSEAEIHKSKCPPEANEGECSKEQILSFAESVEDIVSLASSEKVEMRPDLVPSACNQQDTMPVATDSPESTASDLPLSTVAIAASCEVAKAERSTEERGANLGKTPLVTQNAKVTLRCRLQRPKPNLSRAGGKKMIVSQHKTEEESKKAPLETPDEKNPLEKEKVNISESLEMENTERQNPAETLTDLNEKTGPLEENQAKIFRPARLMRCRMQRPKPNVEKAAERKGILSSQENIGTSVEKNENESCVDGEKNESSVDKEKGESCIDGEKNESCVDEEKGESYIDGEKNESCVDREKDESCIDGEKYESCVDREKDESCIDGEENESCVDREKDESCIDREKNKSCGVIPQRMENEPCKNFQYENIILQPEENSTSFENVQSDEPKVLNECLSVQEGNKANKLKQAPVLRTRFQKPKPNIGRRRMGRRGMSLQAEVPEQSQLSGEVTAALEEIVRPDTLSSETLPDVTIPPPSTTEELESDLKETGRSDTSNKKVSEMNDVTVEMDIALKSTGKEIFMGEVLPEMTDVTIETDTELEASLKISPMEKIPEFVDTTEEIGTNFEETGRREIFPQENGPKELSPISEIETDLQETGKEMPTRERTPDIIDICEKRETDVEEMSALLKAPEEVKTIGEVETYLEETGGETSKRKKALVELIAVAEKEIDWKEMETRDMSMLETVSGKMTAIAETSTHVTETGNEISVSQERGSEEICVSEKMVAGLEQTGKIDISLREHEPEELTTSRQLEAGVIPSVSDDSDPRPSQDNKSISNKISVTTAFVEEKENGEKGVSSHLSHVKSSPNSGHHETPQKIAPLDALGLSSDNLSKSLLQEQKPLQVKPVPFLRSRFRRPKPNLARAAIKRVTTEAEQGAPGKKSEIDKTESVVQQESEEAGQRVSGFQDVSSLMTSRENDKSGHKKEEAVILSSIQTEKNLSPSSSCEPEDESQLTQNQEKGLVSMGTQKMSTVPEETKQSIVQMALPVRGRLHRPRPNVQKARQRQIAEKGDAQGIAKEEGTTAHKDEIRKKSLTMSNSQIETEIEVVSSKVSECGVSKSQSHVVPVQNFEINRRNLLDEKIRNENKLYIPSPAQLIRRRFQKAKPTLLGAHHKKEPTGIEKDKIDQHEAQKPDSNILQRGDSDNELLLKENAEILISLEASARKDCVGSKESCFAEKDTELKPGLSGSVGEETVEDNSLSSEIEKQSLSKQRSHPQLSKKSDYSKIAPHRRALSSASECESDHVGKRVPRKTKPNVTKGRGSKRIRGKTKKEPRASKSMLVTLRASQNEDEDDAEDFESEYEEDTCHLAPDELNKAPVFVPVGLRSPQLISAQIEETMEELEITLDVADVGHLTVVEHQLPSTDVTAQEVQQEKRLQTSPFEMTTGQQTQDQPGPSDGSTEAAIALLTMGERVLQSELINEQSDDNVNHKTVHECQKVSSPVITKSPASFEENKIVSEEQNTKEAGLMEDKMENSLPTRDTACIVTKNLKMKSRFIKPKPNPEKTLGASGFHGHQEPPRFCGTKATQVEIKKETEKNHPKAVELEVKNLVPVTGAENKEQKQLACVPDGRGTSVSQEALTARSEDQEERLQEVQMSVAPVTSSEIELHTFDSGQSIGESSAEEPPRKNTKNDSIIMLHVPEGTPTSIPEVQEENVISPQDLPVNLFGNIHQDGEDEQAFILTLVEIPTDGAEGFTNTSMQLMPSSLLPAPILVKTGNTVESDLSESLHATPVVEDAMCISNSGSDDSEKPPANLDLISRKRFHCSSDECSHVPPAKKSSLASEVDFQEHASEVHSEELNVFQKAGESCKGQGFFPTSESIPTTSEPQKERAEPSFQNTGSRSFDEIRDVCIENSTAPLPQDEMVVPNEEEKTDGASNSEQMDSRTSSSKPPLSRPGRRPLGFLSLICPKNSLDSDEVTQVHTKKRLKPHIPVSRRNLKRSNPLKPTQKKSPESSAPLPSPTVTDTQSENTGSSATQVSSDQPSQKGKCQDEQKQASEEESTTISEYFFGDIFIEVDETE